MCYSDDKNSEEAEACMTWDEYTTAAYKTLPYSENDITEGLYRAAQASSDKEDFTAHDLHALDISIRLRVMYRSQPEQYEE